MRSLWFVALLLIAFLAVACGGDTAPANEGESTTVSADETTDDAAAPEEVDPEVQDFESGDAGDWRTIDREPDDPRTDSTKDSAADSGDG
ncbi:MAG: hypothetical protein AAGD38_14955 [Acidobacteriota bacterium]